MKHLIPILLFAGLLMVNCSGNGADNSASKDSGKTESGLTEFELEHGIGPITEPITLGDIDPNLVSQGRDIFRSKCTACHERTDRFVGPPYGDLVERRSPEFIMNMILNPGQMVREHPEGQKMLAEYMTVMPFQNVSEQEARAILEYLRTIND